MPYTGFDWDLGNERKNEKHEVSGPEVEQVFFNSPLILAEDLKHRNVDFTRSAGPMQVAGCTLLSPSAAMGR